MSVEAPERIFIAPNHGYTNPWGRPIITDDFDEDGTEYVRIDKLEELAAENKKLRTTDDPAFVYAFQLRAEKAEAALAEKDKEIAALKDALEFYADRDLDGYDVSVTNYGLSTEEGHIIGDRGQRARRALARNAGGKDDE